jgi:hypothetical protein
MHKLPIVVILNLVAVQMVQIPKLMLSEVIVPDIILGQVIPRHFLLPLFVDCINNNNNETFF